MKSAEIIAIGTELLGRSRVDTNSLFLTGILEKYGISVKFKSIVGDDFERLASVVENAIKRCDILLITGGLGPTDDDITREAVAKALNRKLCPNEEQLKLLKRRYEKVNVVFKKNSEKQSYLIDGAEVIENGPGSAPGQFIQFEETWVFLLPGVPREMKFMAENFLENKLKETQIGNQNHEVMLNFAGLPESLVDSKLSELNFVENQVNYTILASLKRVQVILTGENKVQVEKFKSKVLEILGNAFYSEGDVFLPETILSKLNDRHLNLSVAESCTGGYLSKQLTDIPGSSNGFLGGVVCYSNSLKEDFLSVPNDILQKFGAVSSNVACYLSNSIRFLTNSDLGIGITGVAGPGHSEKKQQGLVYISISSKNKTMTKKFIFSGTREMVRERAVSTALNLLRLRFLSD